MFIKNNLLKMNIQLLASNDNDNDNDDTLEEKVMKMQEQLIKMNDIIEENKKLKNLNDTLFTKNQELFLKITGENDEGEEDDINEFEEFVGKEFYDKLSNKEKKQLQIILEGEDE